MATVDSFKFSNDQKPIRQPAVIRRRNKMIARLWEQIQLLKSYENGTEFTIRKLKTITDVDGNTKRLPMPKRLRPWWFCNADGKLCLSVKYGSKTLELQPGMTVIQAKNTNDLLCILEDLKQMTSKGELDNYIEETSQSLKMNFKSHTVK